MSDDIVARLLICAKYDPDQKDAADEIERLRADLAACKGQENAEWVKAIAERDAIRAELAEAKIEIEKQRARVSKWVNAAMRNEEYDDDGR